MISVIWVWLYVVYVLISCFLDTVSALGVIIYERLVTGLAAGSSTNDIHFTEGEIYGATLKANTYFLIFYAHPGVE